MVAANNAVMEPMVATIVSVSGASENSVLQRAIMYTPAVTMVAAWISALTGVGPAMASGSQTYRGICADLPVAPTSSNSEIAVKIPAVASTGIPLIWVNTVAKSSEPK